MNQINLSFDKTKHDFDETKHKSILKTDNKNNNEKRNVVIDIADSNIPDELNDIDSEESMEVTSQKLRQFVIKNIVQPAYIADIKETLEWRFRWTKISRKFRWVAQFFLLVSGILASLQTIDDSKWWSIGVITCNTLVFLLNQFSSDAKGESKTMTDEANKFLAQMNIEKIPETTIDIKSNDIKSNDIKSNIDKDQNKIKNK